MEKMILGSWSEHAYMCCRIWVGSLIQQTDHTPGQWHTALTTANQTQPNTTKYNQTWPSMHCLTQTCTAPYSMHSLDQTYTNTYCSPPTVCRTLAKHAQTCTATPKMEIRTHIRQVPTTLEPWSLKWSITPQTTLGRHIGHGVLVGIWQRNVRWTWTCP